MTGHEIATPKQICKAFSHDPSTGDLFWRDTPNGRGFRPRKRGEKVSMRPHTNGRLRIDFLARKYLVHRIIWCLEYGRWPRKFIDHINGDPADNRLVNLREVDNKMNCRNQKLRSTNKSGTMGVQWRKDRQQWIAVIARGGVRRSLGFFDHLDDAVAARRAAEVEAGFHKNHGRVPEYAPDEETKLN